MAPHYKKFDFKLTSDAKIQPVIQKCKQERQILFSLLTIVTRVYRSAEADRVLRQLVMFLMSFFTGCTK